MKMDPDNECSEYNALLPQIEYHVQKLEDIIRECEEPLEGNSFYTHQTLDRNEALVSKQINLLWCGKQATSTICEIGFNAGHSSLLLLLGAQLAQQRSGREDNKIQFIIFDICEHQYTMKCLNYIGSVFPNVQFQFIAGDSIQTVPAWLSHSEALLGTIDVIHIDGGHTYDCITNDFKNMDQLLKLDGIMIVDDTDSSLINGVVNQYTQHGTYIELPMLETLVYQHRVLQKKE